MRNLLLKLLSAAFLTMGVLILMAPLAQAQDQCLPFSGTIYGWAIDNWEMVGDFTIGHKVYHAKISVESGPLLSGDPTTDDVWQGTELWTFDFGKGNTIQLKARFVTEHANVVANTSGIFHYTEVGTFTNGTGMFKHVFGSLVAQGPFGPGVKLPSTIPAPAGEGVWYFVAPTQGTICGLNDHDEKRE
jgi:hypothetical protein